MKGSMKPIVAALVFLGLALQAVPATAQTPLAPVCLYAFSKDLCSARLFDGTWGLPTCPLGGSGCNSLVADDANFRGSLTTSSGLCGEDPTNLVPCDEAPYFIGELIAGIDLRTQRHTSCKARGSWEGPFRIANSAGVSFASGNLVATMGMGTHRKACDDTNQTCGRDCETCHDARVISHANDWLIGTEGTLKGRVDSGPYAGCTFTASFQGDFTANGDSRGPQAPSDAGAWSFCGSIEGVLECRCP